eukprot:6478106-Amphidinium_carterae.1
MVLPRARGRKFAGESAGPSFLGNRTRNASLMLDGSFRPDIIQARASINSGAVQPGADASMA